MKKLVLTSLMAVFAVSGAHAANVINNNPLYRPDQGRFYSITGVESATNRELVNENGTKQAKLSEEFGYGITDHFMAVVKTSLTEKDWFDSKSWDDLSLGLNYRVIDINNWKGDVFGEYAVNNVRADRAVMLDKDLTFYTWTAGMRGGYAGEGWTVAGHAALDYMNTESFNWDESFKNHARISAHQLRFGLDGQLELNQYWNLVAGVEYNVDYENWSDHESYWKGTLGANLNLDETKFVGVYVNKYMARSDADAEYDDEEMVRDVTDSGNWKVLDGFEFGVKFGIDF